MNVGIAVYWFSPHGGMERHVANLARSLRHLGHQVTVYSETPVDDRNNYVRELIRAGIRVKSPHGPLGRLVALPASAEKGTSDPHRQRAALRPTASQISRRAIEEDLRRLKRRHAIDVLHVHGFRVDMNWAIKCADGLGIPVVYTEHSTLGDWLAEGQARERLSQARPALVTGVSTAACAELSGLLGERGPALLARHVVFSADEATPDARVPRSGKQRGKIRITCTSHMRVEKGVGTLVRAMASVCKRHGNVELALAGTGVERTVLERLARETGLQCDVRFPGLLDRNQTIRLLAESDIFVLPSFTEGLPLGLLEAMATGKPVIASRVGGVPEVVEHGVSGILVPPADAEALAGAILELTADRERRTVLGHNAKRRYAELDFTAGRILPEILSIYRLAEARAERRIGSNTAVLENENAGG